MSDIIEAIQGIRDTSSALEKREECFDVIVRMSTGFSSFAEMRRACASGYIPTLNKLSLMQREIGRQLEEELRVVYWIETETSVF